MSLSGYLTTLYSYLRRPSKRKLIRYSYKLRGLTGLEIGGPSSMFSLKGYFPVYIFAYRIDGVNFDTNTMWEGKIEEGETYRFYNKKGFQYIQEATDLSKIQRESYDFILSCHSLEHVANPLKALKEWNRVLKPGGFLVLILPDKRQTFDVNRPYTTMEHMLWDYNNDTGETDETHFQEVIDLHEISRDEHFMSREDQVEKIKRNYQIRGVHHHVFNEALVTEMFAFASFQKELYQEAPPFHMIFIARKVNEAS